MSTVVARVFSGLTRAAFSQRIFNHNGSLTVSRPNSVRFLTLSSQRSANSTDEEKKVNNEPIKFSTSKASHKTWKVERSMGSQFQRSGWKVFPISVFGVCFLLWCALRGESEIDEQLEQHLYKHLPGLLSDEEEEQNKSS